MKKCLKRKRVISVLIVLSMIVSVFGKMPFQNYVYKAEAAAASGIAGNGLAGITIDINAAPYTEFANIDTWGTYAYGPQGCAWFASARVNQLTGKGNMIYSGKTWYNSAYSALGFLRGSELRAPAIACYENHVVIVEKIAGDTVYISEGGMSGYGANASTGYTVIRAVSKANMGHAGAESATTLLGYVYLSGSSSGESSDLSYGNLSTEFVHPQNAGLYGAISNPSGATVSVVGAYVWSSNGTLVVNHTENCGRANTTIYQRLNIVGEALPSGLVCGETYTYQFFAQANGKTYYSEKASFTTPDTQNPVLTDAQITNITSDGYTVSCKASDNYQIDRVQFPTWTTQNGQDDLAENWQTNTSCRGTQNGDTFTFQVKRTDHNNEYGIYATHIYAYDKAGNFVCVDAGLTELKEKSVSAVTTPPVPTQKPSESQVVQTSSQTNITPNPNAEIASSNNIHQQSYMYCGTANWDYANPVLSYLLDNEDGTVSRVEVVDNTIIVETYTKTDFAIVSSATLPVELGKCCGFFAGKEYNYFVFAQENANEEADKEVVRIVQYAKDWTRLKETGLSKINTVAFCDSGSLRMCEYGNMLYIRSCHTMYQSSDSKCHQANIMICYDQSSGTANAVGTGAGNISSGYVSHSFNQFISTDGQDIVSVDHGDAYPRGIVMLKYVGAAGSSNITRTVKSVELLSIPGETGLNYTATMVGGLENSSSHHLVAYSTVDPELFYGRVRNVFIGTVKKDNFSASSVATKQFTDFTADGSQSASNPVLVKLAENEFLLMWEVFDADALYVFQKDAGTHTIQYVRIDGEGNALGEVQTKTGDLSDCQPILLDNKVTWYVTDSGKPCFYSLEPSTGELTAVTKEQAPQTTTEPTKEPAVPTQTPSTATKKPSGISSTDADEDDEKPEIAKVSGLKVKNKKRRKLKVTWEKAENAYGYQVQIATKRSFKKGKKTETAYGTAATLYGLKKKKTYYVRVRGYDWWNGSKIYGKWSAVKKVKIRK